MIKQTFAYFVFFLLGNGSAQTTSSIAEPEPKELADVDEVVELDLGGATTSIAPDIKELADVDEVVELDLGVDQTPRLRGNARKLPYVGYNAYCDLCKNKSYPKNNVGVAILGMPGKHTCKSLYQKGRNSQIPFNYCPVMQTTLQHKCGCNSNGSSSSSGTNKWKATSGNSSSNNSKWKTSSSSSKSKWKTTSSSSSSNWSWSKSTNYSGRFLHFLGIIKE